MNIKSFLIIYVYCFLLLHINQINIKLKRLNAKISALGNSLLTLSFKYNVQLISNNFYFLVLKIWNVILFPKLFWPSVRKKCSSDWENVLNRIFRFLRSDYTLEQLEFKLEKKMGFRNMQENLANFHTISRVFPKGFV